MSALAKQDHEAAALFPLLDKGRFGELVESIRTEGLIHEIILCDDKILDGRNRFRACVEAEVKPRFKKFEGDPFAYAWAANGERRDLTDAQRYGIWVIASEHSAAWQSRQAEIAATANVKRSESQKGIPKAEKQRGATSSGTTSAKQPNRSTGAKAKASKTNRGTVEKMDQLRKHRPELFDSVRGGTMRLAAAMRQMKRSQVAGKVAALPAGKFRVIYADPPWQYNDSREGLGAGDSASSGIDRASTAAGDHYPTMSISELAALDVETLSADDCVLFCWATSPLLPEQIELTKAWGFKYKTHFIWDKGRGSFGHYHAAEAEILLVCTRGSCTPDAQEKEKQIQRWERGRHSAKPDAARAMIDRLYVHGPRVELFRRGDAPEGWAVWGNESEQAEAA